MNQLQTRGIILSRTDYGEADRIITVLTPGHGKLRLMARGVRKPKSKLAGGIELFSISDLTFIRGRGEIGTLISSRLLKYYDRIVHDIERVQLGYELIKVLNRVTEDEPEPEYSQLLEQALAALDDSSVSSELIRAWFSAQLLRQAGHSPNLQTAVGGAKLAASQQYDFDFETMSFSATAQGRFSANTIKFLRLLFSDNRPQAISRIEGHDQLLEQCLALVTAMTRSHLHI